MLFEFFPFGWCWCQDIVQFYLQPCINNIQSFLLTSRSNDEEFFCKYFFYINLQGLSRLIFSQDKLKTYLEGLKLLIQFNWIWKWEEEVWCWWRGCQRQTKTCWVSWSEHWEHKWHDSAQEQSSSYGTGFRDRAKVQSSNILKCFTTISISSANWWLIVLR